MAFKPYFLMEPPYRIISFDGGGIFGYFTALMLRELCEQDETFLDGSEDIIFAGISAGALNALMLAREPCPRDAVLRGDLEKLYHDYRLYANLDPVTSVSSLMGFSAWCSGPLMKELVQDYWGDTTLGELPQRVLIETFDFAARSDTGTRWKPRTFCNFGENNQSDVSAAFLAYGATAPATYRPVEEGISDAGYFAINPIMCAVAQITGFDPDEAAYWRIVDHLQDLIRALMAAFANLFQMLAGVQKSKGYADLREQVVLLLEGIRHETAYLDGALSELQLRHYPGLEPTIIALRADLDVIAHDGLLQADYPTRYQAKGVNAAMAKNMRGLLMLWVNLVDNPVLNSNASWAEYWKAAAHDLHQAFFGTDDNPGYFALLEGAEPAPQSLLGSNGETLPQNLYGLFVALRAQTPNRLDEIQAFSMGTGNFVPGYYKKTFDVGYLSINLFPTNTSQKAYLPPPWFLLLDPGLEATSDQARHVLGANYMRFNPPVLKFPVPNEVLSLYLSRFALWRKFILSTIDGHSKNVTDVEYGAAYHWLEKRGWIAGTEENDTRLPDAKLGAEGDT